MQLTAPVRVIAVLKMQSLGKGYPPARSLPSLAHGAAKAPTGSSRWRSAV